MIIADTGFWLAIANRRDAHHERARAKLATLKEPLITTWPVLTETCHLLLTRLGVHAMQAFIKSLEKGGFEVFELPSSCASRLLGLMEKYADLPMDLADASLVLLAEHLNHGRILSTDQRDIHAYRWKYHEPFTNILFD